jgi:hemoglobin
VKKDIKNREDIMILVNSFYNHVKRDKLIGPIFNDAAKIDWNTHLPKMYDFWETVLLGTGSYSGNTLKKHLDLNNHFKLLGSHFDHWLILFKTTIDELFEGPTAQQAKNKADSIATVIKIKIAAQNK